jgi:hypothetical protein
MSSWLIAAICGLAGASVAELLDLRSCLIRDHQYPWEQSHGLPGKLGPARYSVLVAANLLLGAAAAVAVYGQDPPTHGVPAHSAITWAVAGLAAPAVLQKLGGAIRR